MWKVSFLRPVAENLPEEKKPKGKKVFSQVNRFHFDEVCFVSFTECNQ